MNVVNYFHRVSSGQPVNFGFDLTLKRLQAVNPDEGECEYIDKFRASICKFCKSSGNEDYLAVANEEGNVRIENTKHDRKLDVEFKAHNNAIFDLEWSDCHNRLLLGSGDQTASLWDVREGGVSKIKDFVAHTQSVRSVTFRPFDKDVFATGARDGRVVIWDVRCASSDVLQMCVKPENIINKVPLYRESSGNIINRCRQHQAAFSICSLLFQDSIHLFCSSISESCVDVWDMRKIYTFLKRVPQPLYRLSHPDTSRRNYYTSMCLDTSRTRLYANSKDGTIHSFNVASYSSKPESFYTGHMVSSTYIKCCLSPDDSYLASGSTDGKAYVWNTAQPGAPIAKLNAHKTELSCVDWCRSGEVKIATCSEEYDCTSCNNCDENAFSDLLMVWRVVTENEDAGQSESKKDEIGTISWVASAHAPPRWRKSSRFYRACRALVNERPTITELNSPTVNLPNHVVDGTSPSTFHRCSPSSRQEKENRNWLSSLKKKTPSSLNSKSVHIKKSNSGHKPKACGSLLKFFKAATKEGASAPLESLTEVSNFAESALMNGVMEI